MVSKAIEILRSCQWPEGYKVAESGNDLSPWCRLSMVDEMTKRDRGYLKAWDLIREAVQIKYFLDVSIFGLQRATVSGTLGGSYFGDFASLFSKIKNVESVHPTFTLRDRGIAPPYVTFDIIYDDIDDLHNTVSEIKDFFPSFTETGPRYQWKWEFDHRQPEFKKLLSRDGSRLRKGVVRSLRDAAFERYSGIATNGSNMRRIEKIAPDMLQAFKAGIIKITPYIDTTLIKGINSMVLVVSGVGDNRMQYEQMAMNDELLGPHLILFERMYSNVMVAIFVVSKFYELNTLLERSRNLYQGLRVSHTLFIKNVFNDRIYDSLLERKIVV